MKLRSLRNVSHCRVLSRFFNFEELLPLKISRRTIRALIVALLTIDCVLGSRFAIIDCSTNIAFSTLLPNFCFTNFAAFGFAAILFKPRSSTSAVFSSRQCKPGGIKALKRKRGTFCLNTLSTRL